MASETYNARVIVLRKTKLAESDLILTLIAENGSQLRAVAKGARKPSSTFSSRLELFSTVDVLLNKGRNLDIITEARLVDFNEKLRSDIECTTSAAPIAELLDKVTQVGLVNAKIFDLTRVALESLCTVETSAMPSITAAHLLKTFAFLGLRPSLARCVSCGRGIDLDQCGPRVNLSYSEGGVICDHCGPSSESLTVSPELCKWIQIMLASTFSEISEYSVETVTSFELLQFCQAWVREHIGFPLKSLNFMFASGLYG